MSQVKNVLDQGLIASPVKILLAILNLHLRSVNIFSCSRNPSHAEWVNNFKLKANREVPAAPLEPTLMIFSRNLHQYKWRLKKLLTKLKLLISFKILWSLKLTANRTRHILQAKRVLAQHVIARKLSIEMKVRIKKPHKLPDALLIQNSTYIREKTLFLEKSNLNGLNLTQRNNHLKKRRQHICR